MKKVAVLVIILSFLVLASLPIVTRAPRRGARVESANFSSGELRIRASSWTQKVNWGSTPGGYLTFEASSRGGPHRIVLEVEFPSVPRVPERWVGYAGPLLAWVWAGPQAAVTADGGLTWNLWEADEPGEIRALTLAPDGQGELEFGLAFPSRVDLYKTRDFGRTWMLRSGP